MKKIISLALIALLLPQIALGAFPVGWNATSTTQGWVSPNLVNGISQIPTAFRFIASYFTATSTTASVLPYASSTAITVSGTASTTNLIVSNSTTLGTLTGILQAINGLVSASSSISSNFIENLSGTNTGDVTLAGTPDYITLANQVITRGLIDLTTDISGVLPIANGGTNASTLSQANPLAFNGTSIVPTTTPTAQYFIATSSIASRLPYASSSAITVSGAGYFGKIGVASSSLSANHSLVVSGNAHFGGSITSTSTTATSTFLAPVSLTKIVTSATSTGSNGFDITAGCYAVAGTCISGSGSSASSTLLVDTNTWSGLNAFGNLTATNATTTSLAVLNLATPAGTYLAVNPDGSVIATTTPVGGSASSTLLADTNTWSGLNVFNQATTTNLHITSTTTGANGFDITAGCYSINGTCISGGAPGSGTVNSGLAGQLAYYASDGTAVSGTTTNPLTAGRFVATSSVASIIPYASTTALTISGSDGALRVTNSATFDDGLVANNPVTINDPLTVTAYNGQIQINREAEAGYSQVKIGGTSGVDWGFGVAASSYNFAIFDGYPGANIITLRDHGYQDYYGHDQLVLGGTERSGFGTSTPSAGLSASTTINIGLMIDQRGTEDIAKFLDAGVEVLNLKDGGSLGVGTTTPAVKLDVNGYLKVLQTSTTTACSAAIAGSIFFNQANTHFWGCDGTNWLRLD